VLLRELDMSAASEWRQIRRQLADLDRLPLLLEEVPSRTP
jgi:hypothetical protein